MGVYNTNKRPILVEEISRYREELQIGQKVWLSYIDEDDFKKVDKTEAFVVTEKYTWFFAAENAKGRRETRSYIEMLVEERKKQYADRQSK